MMDRDEPAQHMGMAMRAAPAKKSRTRTLTAQSACRGRHDENDAFAMNVRSAARRHPPGIVRIEAAGQ